VIGAATVVEVNVKVDGAVTVTMGTGNDAPEADGPEKAIAVKARAAAPPTNLSFISSRSSSCGQGNPDTAQCRDCPSQESVSVLPFPLSTGILNIT